MTAAPAPRVRRATPAAATASARSTTKKPMTTSPTKSTPKAKVAAAAATKETLTKTAATKAPATKATSTKAKVTAPAPSRAPADNRPVLTPALERIIDVCVSTLPSLAGLRADDILVVALGAHGDAVASVRSFDGSAARVVVDGKRRRVELGLRPRFFLEGDAPGRLSTIIHELLHLDPTCPGALNPNNRHEQRSQASLDAEARRGALSVLATASPTFTLALAHHGEVFLRSWRRRPCEATAERRFGDVDVFDSVVCIHTAPNVRGGWW